MKDYLSIKELVKEAEDQGIDFGKGDPYNRLRYYTKMGWIPHMIRKKGSKGSTKGHYPLSTVDRLVLIQKLKDQGLSNEDISDKLVLKDKVTNFYSIVKSDEIRNKVVTYATFIMILVILLAQMGYLKIGKPKEEMIIFSNELASQIQIVDSGTGLVTEGENRVFVNSTNVFDNSKIYVTLKGDYSPASRFWVAEKTNGEGFTLELDTPPLTTVEFDWWISE